MSTPDGGDPVDGAMLLSAVHRLFNLEVTEAPMAMTATEEEAPATAAAGDARETGKAAGS